MYGALGLLGGCLLAGLAAAVVLQVGLRYLLRSGFDGLDEIPRYLFVWVVMVGAAAAMQRGEHTTLEYFVNLLPPRGQAAIRAVSTVAGVVLFLSLIRTSLVLVPNAQLQSSPGLGLPLGYVYAAVPVGATLILLPMLWNLAVALRTLWRKPS